jgi:hypothetical protein
LANNIFFVFNCFFHYINGLQIRCLWISTWKTFTDFLILTLIPNQLNFVVIPYNDTRRMQNIDCVVYSSFDISLCFGLIGKVTDENSTCFVVFDSFIFL